MTSSMPIEVTDRRCKDRAASPQSALETTSPTILASAVTGMAAACATRGGGIDDNDPRRPRGYNDRDDGRLPPRRTSAPADNNEEWEGRYRRQPSGPRGPRDDSRDPDRGGGGPRRPQTDRDERYNNRYYDTDNVDDKSGRRREPRGDRRDYYDERHRRDRNPENYRPSNNVDPNSDQNAPAGGKGKKWFKLKKDKATTAKSSSNNEREEDDRNGFDPRGNTSPFPPPPPPPPPPTDSMDINPAETERTPIHYMFPTAESAAEKRKMSYDSMDDEMITMDKRDGAMPDNDMDVPDIPFLEVEENEIFAGREGSMDSRRRRRRVIDEDDSFRASPRRDAVTVFMSSRRGTAKVRIGSMIVGAALGGFIGKVIMFMLSSF